MAKSADLFVAAKSKQQKLRAERQRTSTLAELNGRYMNYFPQRSKPALKICATSMGSFPNAPQPHAPKTKDV